MKKIIFPLLMVSLISSARAQDEEVIRKNAIKINPVSLFALTGNVAYERAVSQNKTLQVGGFYSGVNFSGLKYSGYGITPELRIFLTGEKQAFNGVYVAPFIRYQNFRITNKENSNKTSFQAAGGGATVGWEKMWNGGFTLDVFAGPAYYNGKFKNDADEDAFDLKLGLNGFTFRAGLMIGFGF
ncbi:MAG: DUF3575 domain-containing protein [Bacteroidota bacterium]|nr:DUF3575 domain-containing protein [Bacteroidota bacterium]